MKKNNFRILSGMRPTGKLHLGHYVGALENWVFLQNETEGEVFTNETFFLIADYHTLTTSLDTLSIEQNTTDMVIDWLSVGINPERSPIFRQSQIKEHAELFLLFAMLITTARLERNPSLKEQVRDLEMESVVYGHLGYPVLQAADILLYKGDCVPVGEDQLPHVEITREIARRFNQVFGEVFPEPEHRITKYARLTGLDGKAKMSKSLGNGIFLSDDKQSVSDKLRKAVTDPKKLRKNDSGDPEVCTVFLYHKRFSNQESIHDIEQGCRSGQLGCVECKTKCAESVSAFLDPFLQKREALVQNLKLVSDVLKDGEARASVIAKKTIAEVRSIMKLG